MADVPDDAGGPAEAAQGGIETASRQLNRVKEMLMERSTEAFQGLDEAMRNLGGGGEEQAADVAMTALSHFPDFVT